MSERPEIPQNDETQAQGGWHIPSETSPWQSPEQATSSQVAWRSVKALPEEMDTTPEKRGAWHLPKDSDTTFSPEDEIEVTPAPVTSSTAAVIRPEDLLAEIVGQKRAQSIQRPEDMIPQRKKPTEEDTVAADISPEGETMLVDEMPTLDEDDESLNMSEYIALASLAQGAEDASNVNLSDLSPAERALFNAASRYADELPDDATQTLDQTSAQSASQAEDYARKQLEALNGEQSAAPSSFTQEQTITPQAQYSAEELQLANQFRETRRQVQVLRQMEAQGQIGRQELESRLQQFTILDPQGNWWMIGYDSDQWYRYNNFNGQWELSEPPVPLDAGQPRTETGLGSSAADVMPGSLPYLPDSGVQGGVSEYSEYDATQYSQAQDAYNQQYGIQDTPIPNPGQPPIDPNLTVVGNAVDANTLSYAEPTMQGLNYVDEQATMPSAAAQDYGYDEYQQPYEDVISQARPIPSGLEDPNLDVQAPDFEQLEAQRRNLVRNVVIGGILVAGILFAIVVGGSLLYFQSEYNRVIAEWDAQIAALGSPEFDFQTARVLAADGSVLAEITGEQGARTIVSIERGQVSPFFVHALIASEDPRYYENPGVDPLAIARAFMQNIFAGEITSGASTITQQIVREQVIGNNDVSFDRKLLEALLAIEVSQRYSKNQILDIYINEFFFGEQSYGVEEAANFYFDVSAADLDMAQSALLVGILPSPSVSNPVSSPRDAFSNMRVIFDRMIEVNCLQFQHGEWAQTGQAFCVNENTLVDEGGSQTRLFSLNSNGSFGGLLALQIAEVESRRYEPRQSDIRYPHFVFFVLGQLDEVYGRGAYIERGFTVQTTLDPRVQDAAETALDDAVEDLALNGAVTGAVLVLDPQTGAIRAMVGSPDFNDVGIEGQNNNVFSYNQAGSAIKPVVYAAALNPLENGSYYTPATITWDIPTQYNIDGTIYAPTNFDRQTRGPVPVRYALAQSLNIPAVRTYAYMGGQHFVNTANAMGIEFDPNPNDDVAPFYGLSTAIGATEVSLYDLAHAYATIANDGVRPDLYAIEGITERTPNGNQVDVELGDLTNNSPQQVLQPQVAYLLQNILSDDVARTATINGVRSSFPPNSQISGASLGLPNQNVVAVKTGTNNTTPSQDNPAGNPSRIWTVGFTNNYVVGVWVGTLNQGTPMSGNVSGLAGAAPAWNDVMRAALNNRNPGQFERPQGIVSQNVCFLTGTLESENCQTRVPELFVAQLPPPPASQGFATTVSVDSWTGLLANEWCPENQVLQTVSNISDPQVTSWLTTTNQGRSILNTLGLPSDLQASPTQACQQGSPLPTIRILFPNENAVLSNNVAITGQISANDLQRWEILITEVGTENFRSIMSARTDQIPTAGTTLHEWDSRSVQNGQYIIRLAAYSNSNGGYIFRDVRVGVQNTPPSPTPQPTQDFSAPIITPLPFDLPTSTPDPFGNN